LRRIIAILPNSMSTENWLSATNIVLTAAAILAAPVIALWLSARFERRANAHRAKRDLFSAILEIRHDLLSVEFVRSLNTIDIVFVDDRAVREAWSRYYSVLNDTNLNNPAGWSIRDEKRRDLLLAMAKAMGWESRISTADILRTYTPQFAGEQALLNVMKRQVQLATYAAKLRQLGLPHPLTGFQVPPAGVQVSPPVSSVAASSVPLGQPTPAPLNGNEEGFYLTCYGGRSGSGSATLLFKAGEISGFDTFGGNYDGTYRKEADGGIVAHVTLTTPPGVGLATGAPARDTEQSFAITARLPANFANGNPVPIEVQGQIVQATFTKVRSAPMSNRN